MDWQSGPATYIVGVLLSEIAKNLVYQQHSKGKGTKAFALQHFKKKI